MIFWTGKHKGKSIELVKKIEPSYIKWCEEEAPWLLKEKGADKKEKLNNFKPKPMQGAPARKEVPEDSDVPPSSIQPNTDFLNQKNEKPF